MKTRLYQLFRRSAPVPAGRGLIALMTVIAALCTTLAVARVHARHQLVSLGYDLSRAGERVRELREVRRKLEVERATLANPERIRALATELGMVPVPADQIRVVRAAGTVALATEGSR
jgi:cell division protein FtsL